MISFGRACTGVPRDGVGGGPVGRTAGCGVLLGGDGRGPVVRDQPWGGDHRPARRLGGWQGTALAAAVAVATR